MEFRLLILETRRQNFKNYTDLSKEAQIFYLVKGYLFLAHINIYISLKVSGKQHAILKLDKSVKIKHY